MQSDRGTRREHLLQKKNRPKPQAEWVIKARHYGLRGAPFLFLGLVLLITIKTGWLGQKYAALTESFYASTADSGVRAEHILIEGRHHATQDEVIDALNVTLHQPLLSLSPQILAEQLKTVPWVASAIVQRRLPNTLYVQVIERTPIGFWQRNQTLSLVDKDGMILATEDLGRWGNDLPILIGENAPQAAPEMMQELAKHPSVYGRVRAMTYINNRRWNLRLDNHVDVLLPEIDMPKALDRLDKRQKEEQILDKDIISIDLRLADRLGIMPAQVHNTSAKSQTTR